MDFDEKQNRVEMFTPHIRQVEILHKRSLANHFKENDLCGCFLQMIDMLIYLINGNEADLQWT